MTGSRLKAYRVHWKAYTFWEMKVQFNFEGILVFFEGKKSFRMLERNG